MVVLEVVAGVMVLVLAVVTTVGVIIGCLSVLGALKFSHCEHCKRLTFMQRSEDERVCWQCRHALLIHPVHALHGFHLFHRG